MIYYPISFSKTKEYSSFMSPKASGQQKSNPTKEDKYANCTEEEGFLSWMLCTNHPFHHSSIPGSNRRAPPRTRKTFTSATKDNITSLNFTITHSSQIFLKSQLESPTKQLDEETQPHRETSLGKQILEETYTLQKIVAGAQGRPERFGLTNLPPPRETQARWTKFQASTSTPQRQQLPSTSAAATHPPNSLSAQLLRRQPRQHRPGPQQCSASNTAREKEERGVESERDGGEGRC